MKRFAWELSTKNSFIQFKVKWFQISSIAGQFLKFHAEINTDASFTDPIIYFFIEASSVETLDDKWNNILRRNDIVGSVQQPFIEFNSAGGCIQRSGKIWELSGDLQIRGVKKDITLVVNFSDIKTDKKKTTAVFHFFGTISRRLFELGCPEGNDVADEVQINAKIVMTKKGSLIS